MCQVHGPTPLVTCCKCGAAYYESSAHSCKVFVPFDQWDAELQARAAKVYAGDNRLLAACRRATRNVASWPLWSRQYVWAEEFQHSIKS
jgi:hypothetical protein